MNELGKVEKVGRGETAILARILDKMDTGYVTFLEEVKGFAWNNPPANNFVDALSYEKLKQLQILPSDLCTDEEFLRRAYLDATGRLPNDRRIEALPGRRLGPTSGRSSSTACSTRTTSPRTGRSSGATSPREHEEAQRGPASTSSAAGLRRGPAPTVARRVRPRADHRQRQRARKPGPPPTGGPAAIRTTRSRRRPSSSSASASSAPSAIIIRSSAGAQDNYYGIARRSRASAARKGPCRG